MAAREAQAAGGDRKGTGCQGEPSRNAASWGCGAGTMPGSAAVQRAGTGGCERGACGCPRPPGTRRLGAGAAATNGAERAPCLGMELVFAAG